MTILEQKEDFKKEMLQYLERGNTWVDLCERFVQLPETKELLPKVFEAMQKVLSNIDYIESVINPE
ncbi:MAG: hypothetical protein EO766_12195 [Hydrotalea sp. AMD]|uniref:hypothetical protein n=1 Tax=Hydrotalea sp. AMD TaxID=2501297 RepID=UPI0010262095|nr:hypothetical protein [Hydrotalea sp. AMD]RWZ87278.1 MAG: hypothetical protein EO766_12195 [Hydrotalea sp. AMD]